MIRIAITGPESSGKTTLAKELSHRLNAAFIPEFAREYLEKTDGKYQLSDIEEIAKGHRNQIDNSQNSIQIIDTDFIVLKIWSEYRFGHTSSLIDDYIAEELFDLYLVCEPDIPWEDDPLRENQHDRDELFKLYIKHLNDNQFPYELIKGSVDDRVEKCLRIIEERFNLNS